MLSFIFRFGIAILIAHISERESVNSRERACLLEVITLGAAMNKPPDPQPCLLQVLPISATSAVRLSDLLKSLLLCHHCSAICILPPLSTMICSSFQSYHPFSSQIWLPLKDFFRSTNRGLAIIFLVSPLGESVVIWTR